QTCQAVQCFHLHSFGSATIVGKVATGRSRFCEASVRSDMKRRARADRRPDSKDGCVSHGQLLLFSLTYILEAILSVATGNNCCLIWRIRLRRIRRFEHRECVRYKEQQAEHECDNSRFTCFHTQTVSTPFLCC